MDAASGDAKVDDIAAILREFVGQHNGMISRMMSMHGSGMMQQMMPTMQASSSPESRTATKSENPDAGADHTQHHPAEK